MAKIALPILGLLLISVAVQDLFHTLFHPAKRGDVSDWVVRQIWRIYRNRWPGNLTMAGPIAFVTIVCLWSVSVIVGFALIYLPSLPDAFVFAQGLDASRYASFLGAVNVSVGGLITLSTGVVARNLWIQLALGVESIFGFAILTASVSWILSIYPVLEHRKSLAHEATLLHFSEVNGIRRLDEIGDSDLQQILFGIAGQLTTSRNELIQFPITYYFHESERKSSLAGILPYLADIAELSLKRSGAVALAAATLGGAIDDYLKSVAEQCLGCQFIDRHQLLREFAKDHLREMVRAPQLLAKVA